MHRDPWQIDNLADDPAYRDVLVEMRSKLVADMQQAGDLGLLPEREMDLRSQGSTPFEIATDPSLNPIGKLLDAAWIANQMDVSRLPELVSLMEDPDAAVRWWGAIGLAALGRQATAASNALTEALTDSSPDVRVAAAEALHHLGQTDLAVTALRQALGENDVFVRLEALNVCQRMGPAASPLVEQIRQAEIKSREHSDAASYVGRMVQYLPEMLSP